MTHQTQNTTAREGSHHEQPHADATRTRCARSSRTRTVRRRPAHRRDRRPEIADDEVLVQVQAAGLDRGTWHLMTGQPYPMRIVDSDSASRRTGCPDSTSLARSRRSDPPVTRFSPGDEVFGISRGSFAEYAAVHEDKLARKPANLTFEQAAAVPISAGTALQALTDAGHVEPGQSVLIIGASGGVGSYAVQLAKAFGAEVTGVCSTAKLDLVSSLGADHVIDYTRRTSPTAPTRTTSFSTSAATPHSPDCAAP